jgi:cyclase
MINSALRRAGVSLIFVLLLGGVYPVFAQVDLSGYWGNRPHEDNMARGPGLEVGEYEGYPVNAAARAKGYSWEASIYSNPERQCIPLGIMTANSGFRMWKEIDPVSQREIAWHLRLDFQAQERTIWMDGRPHPHALAPHTWQGFSTGKWVNNQLVVTTTHLKLGVIERNGIPRSDEAMTVEHFIRRGDILTVVHIVYDPVWLEEPFIQSREYALDIYARQNGSLCVPVNEIAGRPKGYVPHYLPGKNPLILEASRKYEVPEAAVRGGADTMYPEFALKMRNAARTDQRASRGQSAPINLGVKFASQPEGTLMPVEGNIYVMVGSGGNTIVQVGEQFVFVVDPPAPPQAERLVAAVAQITNKPIRYVINTHFHPDHIGGNVQLSKAGTAVGGGGGGGGPQINANDQSAPILAHENVLRRVSTPTGAQSKVPFEAWPTETYVGDDFRLFNGEAVKLVHLPRAHTDGDTIIFFQRSDVIAVGDVFSTVTYPIIDRQSGGSINGIIAALNQVIDLTTPKDRQEGGTYVVPGHGRISDQADLVEYRDMVTIIRDRIADAVKRGLTLEQIKAEQPTIDYDPRYGGSTGSWTKDMFIEAVYQDLKAK